MGARGIVFYLSVCLSVHACVHMRRRHSPATLSLTGRYKNCCIIAYFCIYLFVLFTYEFVRICLFVLREVE